MPNHYTTAEVLTFLKKVSIMTIAVSGKNNYPASHVMLFAVDEDFTMYFATTKSSKKNKDLSENNKIGISVWKEHEMLVQINANVTPLEGAEAEDAVDKLAEATVSIKDVWPPVLQINNHDYIAYKITPFSVRALDLSSIGITHTQTLFTDIKIG